MESLPVIDASAVKAQLSGYREDLLEALRRDLNAGRFDDCTVGGAHIHAQGLCLRVTLTPNGTWILHSLSPACPAP